MIGGSADMTDPIFLNKLIENLTGESGPIVCNNHVWQTMCGKLPLSVSVVTGAVIFDMI